MTGWGYSAGAHLVSLLGLAQDLEKTKEDKLYQKTIVAGGTPADLHGANDWIVEYEQMTAFEDKLKKAGVKVESHTVSTIGHVAVFLFSGESLEKSFKFLEQNI